MRYPIYGAAVGRTGHQNSRWQQNAHEEAKTTQLNRN